MPKKLIRVIRNYNNQLWDNEHQREHLRQHLNSLGFYVITGVDDSLEVSVISERKWYE